MDGVDLERPPGSRVRAVMVVTLLPILLFLAVVALVDRPIFPTEVPGRSRRAALAIRDPVDPVETLVTWAFVRPRLEAAYGEVRTVTERGWRDGARAAFVADLRDLSARHEVVDVFCLAHTNDYVAWLEDLPRETTGRIRLVYNGGCECGGQASRWLGLGAEAYVAHPGSASHAPFFVWFLRRWLAVRAAAGAYGADPSVSEAAARVALIAALVLGGVVAGGLTLRSAYRLHLHRRAGIAFLATGFLHLPVLSVAIVETYALLLLLRAW